MKVVNESFKALKAYCEAENFAGWDPYDGLNSKVFQATPLKYWDVARLVWIQGFKRSPINFRKLLLVPKGHNAKGIALFLNGYCNLYEIANKGCEQFGTKEEILEKINELSALLLKIQNKNYSGACWGYNFDWQSKAFFLPTNTPTVVATAFCVEALIRAYEITKNDIYLNTACSSANFVISDLNRIPKPEGKFMFSYSPLDDRAVYNASLLGSKILALIYKYTNKEEYKKLALSTAHTVCLEQNRDGSFPHSDQVRNLWRDSFHTGFKLECLEYCKKYCKDETLKPHIDKGFEYWLNNFFDHKTGFSYYYDRGMKKTLVDLHCVSQAITTICKLNAVETHTDLLNKITAWALEHMQSDKGYFYFQKNSKILNKIQYMRWPNAWMFYGMSYYFLNTIK